MEVIIESFGFAQELRAEDDVPDAVFFPDALGISDRDGGFDDHHHIGIDLKSPFDGILHCGSIKEMIHVIIIRRGRDDDQFCSSVCGSFVSCSMQVEFTFAVSGLAEETFDLVILYGTDELVESVCLRRSGSDRSHFMLLSEQDCK